MDIWAWVQAAREGLPDEESALARRIRRLPGWVTDQHHARVDSVVPEMLADIRRLDRPWLEVFVRHWRLQSLVFHRQQITESLPEAIDLLDRAHREDTRECPQSVCVAQDVCASYGYADGPGYAPQRMKVSEETLESIDASWPCFHCISSERISALLDDGRPGEALAAIEEATEAMRDAGHVIETGDFAWNRAHALRELGRLEEALQVVERAHASAKGRSFEREKALYTVLYKALLGRVDEAASAFPPWEAVSDTASLFENWCETAHVLAMRGAPGIDGGVLRSFATAARQLLGQGCPRDAFTIACWGAELCGVFDRRAVGGAFLDLAREAREKLVADCGASEKLERAERAVEALPEPELPDTWEVFEAGIADGVSFDVAMAAHARWPEQHGFALSAARYWRTAGFPGRARAMNAAVLEAHPDDAAVWMAVGDAMRDERAWADLERHLSTAPEGAALQAGWLESYLKEARGDRDGAIEVLDRLEGLPAAGVGIRVRKAALCRDLERWDDVLQALNGAVTLGMEPGSPDWDRMVAATLLGEHAAVHDSCARLGIELESDTGPIEEDWGVVRLRYPESERRHSWARRTGPVTATVMSIHGPSPERERHGDRVVFQPLPLDEDREYPLFGVVRVVDEGGMEAFALDGAHPGDEALGELRRELDALGIANRATHSSAYRLRDPHTETEVPGCYLRLAVPRDRPDLKGVLHTTLSRFAAETGNPYVWIELLEALDDPVVEEHRARAEEWGML